MNAVNMVDGLDGLATGVVGIGAIAFFVFCYQLTNLNNASLASTGALLSAMLGGRLRRASCPTTSTRPALFMGDSGSMLIGLVLSASAITLTGQYSGDRPEQGRDGLAREPGADLPAAGAADHRSWWSRSPTWSSR